MQSFCIYRPTGFSRESSERTVIRSLSEGWTYYPGKAKKFNLPAGQYMAMGNVYPLEKPVRFPRSKPGVSPVREINDMEKRFRVVWVNTPHKAYVLPGRKEFDGIIFVDPNFWRSIGAVERRYVLTHELAHLCLPGGGSENDANLLAQTRMLDLGYNPSMIAGAINNTFTSKANKQNCLALNIKNWKK